MVGLGRVRLGHYEPRQVVGLGRVRLGHYEPRQVVGLGTMDTLRTKTIFFGFGSKLLKL